MFSARRMQNLCPPTLISQGSGKTHTMNGALSLKASSRGIIPRVFTYVFAKLEEQAATSGHQHTVKVSFLQIYKDKISDLLSPTEDANGICPHARCFLSVFLLLKPGEASDTTLATHVTTSFSRR